MLSRSRATKARTILSVAFLSVATLTACNSFDPKVEGALEQFSAEEIYQRGEYELERGRESDAAFYFGEIERLYPYSEWAKRALIMQALPIIVTKTTKTAVQRHSGS